MLELCFVDGTEQTEIEFDDYVPATITWAGAHRLLDEPAYVTYRGEAALLELKFHPRSGHLLELVLVRVQVSEVIAGRLEPISVDELLAPCWSPAGSSVDVNAAMSVVAYDDFLLIQLAAEAPSMWVRSGQAIFGKGASDAVVAFCIPWDSDSRESFLEARA